MSDVVGSILNFKTVFALILLTMLVSSCDKFEGDQTIPAYLKIENIKLENNPVLEEGQLTNAISDVWVYVDDQPIGAFELPSRIPVLAEGPHKLSLYAGVKFNGIGATRAPYPFYKPQVIDDFNFVVDSITEISPKVEYYDNVEFAWKEDFEDASLSLVPTSSSDTTISVIERSTTDPDFGLYGSKSGAGYADASNPVFEVSTSQDQLTGFDLPKAGQPVFVEMDFKTNTLMAVGIFARTSDGITQHAILVLNSTQMQWKKVYVNLSPSISAFNSAYEFNVFFRVESDPSVDESIVILDNLKLLYRGSK